MRNKYLKIFYFCFFLFCCFCFNMSASSGFVSFGAIVTAIRALLHDFCGIIAGLCGFIGLSRFAYIAVTGGHDAVGSLLGAVVGYAAATIATTII